MGVVRAVCISEKKGTEKQNVHKAKLVADSGLKGDAHAGNWHRQVSLLSYEQIEAFRQRGAQIEFGAFGENLVVEGFDLKTLPIEKGTIAYAPCINHGIKKGTIIVTDFDKNLIHPIENPLQQRAYNRKACRRKERALVHIPNRLDRAATRF